MKKYIIVLLGVGLLLCGGSLLYAKLVYNSQAAMAIHLTYECLNKEVGCQMISVTPVDAWSLSIDTGMLQGPFCICKSKSIYYVQGTKKGAFSWKQDKSGS